MATLRPPPPSRTRAVLKLQQAVKLYEMQHQITLLSSIKSFVEETLDARPTMFVRTITTDSIRDCDENEMKQIQVNFYASSSDNEDVTRERVPETTNIGIQKISFFFVMPSTWSPRMYLACLNFSISTYSVLSVETVRIKGRSYLSLNEVDHHFILFEVIQHKLVTSASFCNVEGGGGYGSKY
jgi:hypothetical protein